MRRLGKKIWIGALLVLAYAPSGFPQTESGASVWSVLSGPSVDTEKSAVTENVEIVRDRVHITLRSGRIQFLKPVNGVVFGAVFHGEGRVKMDPPNALEAQQLALFTGDEHLSMSFTDATFSFSDGLMDEVAKQAKFTGGGSGDEAFYGRRQQEREDQGAEYLPVLFKSVMSPDHKRTGYFLADLKTKERGWVEVRDDATQLEEIRVGRWTDVGPFKILDYWVNFPAGGRDPRHAYDDPAARQDFLVTDYKLTTSLSDSAELDATAHVTLQPRYSGERALLFHLDSNLRLSSVKDANGRDLEYFQARERKDHERTFGNYVAVTLKEATTAGQALALDFQYGGKHVVYRVGDGNYFCPSFGWYPAPFSAELGVDEFAFRSNFDLTFRSPKKYKLIATGAKAGETVDGKELVTRWKSEIPVAAAGFAYGDYKVFSSTVDGTQVDVYANNQPDDLLRQIQEHFQGPSNDLAGGSPGEAPAADIGVLTPSALGKTINIETGNTLRVFENYFGPYPYKQLAVTNIVGSYGQGWPGLLYLSWVTFLDSTQRHALGIRNQVQLTDFFRGHESSHQWWGHRVGWKSYHDQWLSEGFAEFSGLLFVQYRENLKEALTQFREDKEKLLTPDQNGHKTMALGPIWMGQRIRSSVTSPGSYQNLIYSKGGYVLQMLREQLMDTKAADPEHIFKSMMRDYCLTYDNKPASTEDFKAIVEKHMTRNMDLDGNRKMDWFFNQYVYGTGYPQYTFHASLTAAADGKTSVSAVLDRSGVPDTWKDSIPLYAHMGDKVTRIGSIAATHPQELVNVVLPGKVDKVTINDREDLLADVKQ